MINSELIFNRISEALLCDYSSVYYIDTRTNEYLTYSLDPKFRSLKLGAGGKDFFKDAVTDAEKVLYEEDKQFFLESISKERLLKEIKNGTMHKIVYRLMMDGKPVYHSLRLIRGVSRHDDYFILGVINIEKEMQMRQETERLTKERSLFNQIAQSLASYYDTIYYIDFDTTEYIEFSSSTQYEQLDISKTGFDFFEESKRNIKKYVHPDDVGRVSSMIDKNHISSVLASKRLFTVRYRLLIDGDYRFTRLNAMWASDKKHLIIGVEDIDKQTRTEISKAELAIKTMTYTQLLSSLAYKYSAIYYIDSESGKYLQYTPTGKNSSLNLANKGDDFFEDAPVYVRELIYKDDRDMVLDTLDKQKLLSLLRREEAITISCRQAKNDDIIYVNLRIAFAADKRHIVFGIADINDQVKRENEYRLELINANKKAMNDELTGVKNMNAYQEIEASLQSDIDNGSIQPFAVLICDLNNLKHINDTLGHKSGDEYIKTACGIICGIFAHSPVFRIGGDEFVVILRGADYTHRVKLFSELRRKVIENSKKLNAPVIASGIAEFDSSRHSKVIDVFEVADNRMYKNKKQLKRSAI